MADELSNEEISERLRQELQGENSDSSSEPAGGSGEDGSGQSDDGTQGQSATAPTIEYFDLGDGKKIAREDAERYQAFEQYLIENPQFAQALQGISDGSYELIPTEELKARTTPIKDEPELDLDDPNIKYLHDKLQTTQSSFEELQSKLKQHEEQITRQTQATFDSILGKAKESFQSERQLTDEQMTEVFDRAGSLNVLPGLLNASDPVTGLPRAVDPLDAVGKALELAYWSIPEYRDQEIQRQLTQNKTDNDRKRTLSSLGGSGGSVSKDQKAPTTRQEIHEAMVKDIAAAMMGQDKE